MCGRTDLPQFGVNIAAPAMLRFWRMLAHYHGQTWTAADPARSLGVSEPTVRRYLDTLTQTLMVRQLQPWHQNLDKRQVKAPKIYFRDTGLLHALMGVPALPDLLVHPRCGASWEGFALEQVLRLTRPDEAYFWGTYQGAGLDLLMLKGAQRIGVEFKRADVPTVTRSMRTVIDDLKLDALYVVDPGDRRYTMFEGVQAVPLWALLRAQLIRRTLEKDIQKDPVGDARAYFERLKPLDSFSGVDSDAYVRGMRSKSRILRTGKDT